MISCDSVNIHVCLSCSLFTDLTLCSTPCVLMCYVITCFDFRLKCHKHCLPDTPTTEYLEYNPNYIGEQRTRDITLFIGLVCSGAQGQITLSLVLLHIWPVTNYPTERTYLISDLNVIETAYKRSPPAVACRMKLLKLSEEIYLKVIKPV